MFRLIDNTSHHLLSYSFFPFEIYEESLWPSSPRPACF